MPDYFGEERRDREDREARERLRREEAVLGGRGWIGLGKSAVRHGDHSVRFTLQPEIA